MRQIKNIKEITRDLQRLSPLELAIIGKLLYIMGDWCVNQSKKNISLSKYSFKKNKATNDATNQVLQLITDNPSMSKKDAISSVLSSNLLVDKRSLSISVGSAINFYKLYNRNNKTEELHRLLKEVNPRKLKAYLDTWHSKDFNDFE